MEVEEAIEKIKIWYQTYLANSTSIFNDDKAICEVISLLKQGEKYKQIVGEIDNEFGDGILQNENGFGVKLEHLIEIKKQKYFPKEAKTITIEKSLLVDIVKQIDKCFRNYVRQHMDRDIPCNLDILSNSIVSNIEKIFEEAR